jgi:hypothetical protein
MSFEDPELLGTSGAKDDRGLVSVTVPYFAETLAAALRVGASPLGGLSEQSRTFRAGPSGHFEVEVTFEGEDSGDGKSDSEREADAVYSAQGSFREEPIESHPKIEDLVKKYNGQRDSSTGKVTFPASMEGTGGTNALAGEEGVAAEKPNPMAGVEKYMALEIVWTRSYIQSNKPTKIFANVGKVIKAPPGGPPKLAGRKSWLVMPPKLTKRGKVWEVEEQWTLLPEGSPEDVYNL